MLLAMLESKGSLEVKHDPGLTRDKYGERQSDLLLLF